MLLRNDDVNEDDKFYARRFKWKTERNPQETKHERFTLAGKLAVSEILS